MKVYFNTIFKNYHKSVCGSFQQKKKKFKNDIFNLPVYFSLTQISYFKMWYYTVVKYLELYMEGGI